MNPEVPPSAKPYTPQDRLDTLLREARECRVCEAHLPLGARPLVRGSATSRILIVSQAPGTKAHLAGMSFLDASGDRLRGWLDLPPDVFYDTSRVAIVPMGLCYPGHLPKGGDLPPRPECAPLWHGRIRAALPRIALTLIVGGYAQNHLLGSGSVTDHVRRFRDYLPHALPLPHPSWRTGAWERNSPWFAHELLPVLRARVRDLLDTQEERA